jgi:hypothetical protein
MPESCRRKVSIVSMLHVISLLILRIKCPSSTGRNIEFVFIVITYKCKMHKIYEHELKCHFMVIKLKVCAVLGKGW